eukprot:jgi/Mesen1/7577/ME000392S06837
MDSSARDDSTILEIPKDSPSVDEAMHTAAESSAQISNEDNSSTPNTAGDLDHLADKATEPKAKLIRNSSTPTDSFQFGSKPVNPKKAPGFTRSVTEHPSNQGGRLKKQYDLTEKEREQRSAQMAKLLVDVVKKSKVQGDYTIKISPEDLPQGISPDLFLVDEEEELDQSILSGDEPVAPLNICILIVGTRGDVQPFVAIGRRLKDYGHRVRLATHANFREFVTSQGLEFFPLGGDPKILAEYMVKNKGFLPSGPSEIIVQRKQLKAIIQSTWPACTEADVESKGEPFVADAIIANPPSVGHIHVAEALKVPLHIMFTMPWTATREWPHPLARIVQVTGFENRFSYAVVENVIWVGVRDLVNDFRKKKLKLPPVTFWGEALGGKKKVVPHGYIWSPSLAPKPKDWGSSIDVVGFCYLNLATDYKPDDDFVAWLKDGPPPIYVGFGSLPVQNPKGLTSTIIKAIEHTNQRGIIQKGWGGLGDVPDAPKNVWLLGNCPHDWLFPQCKAVVHHGGAGTTAAGLKSSCPTTVVPFFGDQPFWGSRVHAEGVGPEPIPIGSFNFEKLVKAIEFMIQPQVKVAAETLAERMSTEDGVEGAVKAFHKHLPKGIKHGGHATPWLKKKEHRLLKKIISCGCSGAPVKT